MVTLSENTGVRFKYDGMEYSLDIGDLSGQESGVLKTYVHGYRGVNDMQELFASGDIQLLVVLVGLAMARSGNPKVNYKHLLSQPISAFEILGDDESDPTGEGEPEASGPPSSQESTT